MNMKEQQGLRERRAIVGWVMTIVAVVHIGYKLYNGADFGTAGLLVVLYCIGIPYIVASTT